MGDPYRKLAIGRVLVRTAIAIGILAYLMKYAIGKSVTASDFVSAIQATPLALPIFLDAMDYFIDKTAYYSVYNKVYQAFTGGKRNDIMGILSPIIVSAVIFVGALAILGGVITANLNAYNPGVLLWAGIMAAYTMLPETGDEPWMTILWVAAQLVGGFSHVAFLPPMLMG
ncbi:hypothetical protein P8X24_11630 [Pyrococcus kukulkanii]|uniref:hypothetical protein n=1 Tax=Pyrococcus kukulkanii TaxID=1609559 RepID=UPI0035619ED4